MQVLRRGRKRKRKKNSHSHRLSLSRSSIRSFQTSIKSIEITNSVWPGRRTSVLLFLHILSLAMPPTISSLLAGRAPALLRHGRRVPQAFSSRAFTTAGRSPSLALNRSAAASALKGQASKRLGTITVLRSYSTGVAGSEAPNPNAYIDSGVVKPQHGVDVKKVLVIGSGGLAIGQAGEFDYSGMS